MNIDEDDEDGEWVKIPVRIALRVEGDFWVAYIAPINTMVGAAEVSRIHMRTMQRPERKQQFIELMQEVIADFVEDISGARPDAHFTKPAPESERGGSA